MKPEKSTSQENLTTSNNNMNLKKVNVDIVPVALKLLTNKGVDISPVYVIQQESVFEDPGDEDIEYNNNNDQDGDGGDIMVSPNEFFTFSKSRKYVCISI